MVGLVRDVFAIANQIHEQATHNTSITQQQQMIVEGGKNNGVP
jgi:hypothetical protein